MKDKKFIFSALILFGVLTLVVPAAWSQDMRGSEGIPERMGSSQGETPQRPAESSADGSESAQQGEENIKEVQQALKEQGYDPGPVDGVLGPKTEEALKSFQQANELEATGKLDAQTAQKLGIKKGAEQESGSQPETGGQQESGGQKSM